MLTTYKEIQRRVGQRIQNMNTSTTNANDILPKIKNWINERYWRIMRSKPWPGLVKKTTLSIVASQKDYALNRDVGRIITVFDTTNAIPVKRGTVADHIRNKASALDQTGNVQTGDPSRYYPIGVYTVKAEIGSTAEKIDVVSDSSSDTTPLAVHIKGLVSSVETEEDVVLTGTTSATSANTYDASQKLEVSIGTTDGTEPVLNGGVTVDGATSGTVFAIINKFSLATQYQWIEVSPTPDSDASQPSWDIWHERVVHPLQDNNDIPLIDCTQEIIQGVYADALREDGQPQEAELAENRFVFLVEELWASMQNPDEVEQFIPYDRDAVLIDDYGRNIFIE